MFSAGAQPPFFHPPPLLVLQFVFAKRQGRSAAALQAGCAHSWWLVEPDESCLEELVSSWSSAEGPNPSLAAYSAFSPHPMHRHPSGSRDVHVARRGYFGSHS